VYKFQHFCNQHLFAFLPWYVFFFKKSGSKIAVKSQRLRVALAAATAVMAMFSCHLPVGLVSKLNCQCNSHSEPPAAAVLLGELNLLS
jgi:hypothetical protein